MKTFQESEIKYLAGLLDADGCLSFKFCKTSSGKVYLYLVLGLSASKKIDRQGYIYSLGKRCGKTCEIHSTNPNHTDAIKWNVQSRSELNQLLPRLLKHMFIKAKHWERLYNKYIEYKGIDISGREEELKTFSSESRKDVGPIKPKNYLSRAYIAGLLDGDGCYYSIKGKPTHVGVITHTQDSEVLYMLQKSLGGSVYEPRDDNSQLWRRGLGISHKDFAQDFLKIMVKHSRLKKWKIEQMLSFYNQPQRLTNSSPTGFVIV